MRANQYNIEWNVKRILAKANYHIHTDAIDKYIIPKMSIFQKKNGPVLMKPICSTWKVCSYESADFNER